MGWNSGPFGPRVGWRRDLEGRGAQFEIRLMFDVEVEVEAWLKVLPAAGHGNELGIDFSRFRGIEIWWLVGGRCAGGKKDPKNTPEGPKSRGAYLGQKWELWQTG